MKNKLSRDLKSLFKYLIIIAVILLTHKTVIAGENLYLGLHMGIAPSGFIVKTLNKKQRGESSLSTFISLDFKMSQDAYLSTILGANGTATIGMRVGIK